MKVVYNKIIPFGRCKCMAAWPLLFTKSKNLTEDDKRHEEIHGEQQKELLLVGFLVLYVLFFCFEFIACCFNCVRGYKKDSFNNGAWKRAYRNNLFEREAYKHEKDADYLKNRKYYAWVNA